MRRASSSRPSQPVAGASEHGIAEDFPLDGARTLYGATKLAAELLIAEYADAFGVRGVIDRCGVIAGPWQMGKVDQGVFTHWLLAHRLGRPLTYIGYGGTGKQVRDLLHVDDLCELILEQLADPEGWDGATVNVGGGVEGRLSLRETTDLCRELTGNEVPIEPVRRAAPGRRAVLRVGLPARCSRAPTGARRAARGRSSPTRWRGSRPTSAR